MKGFTLYFLFKMHPNALLIWQNFIICKKWVLQHGGGLTRVGHGPGQAGWLRAGAKWNWAPVQWWADPFSLLPLFSWFSKYSNQIKFVKYKMVLLLVQNFLNLAKEYISNWWTTFSIGPTSNSHWISLYKIWNKFQFEYSLNFNGVWTLWEKSDKFAK
jgi:hypothetical protein